jgi:hypothetical protein
MDYSYGLHGTTVLYKSNPLTTLQTGETTVLNKSNQFLLHGTTVLYKSNPLTTLQTGGTTVLHKSNPLTTLQTGELQFSIRVIQ